MMGSGLGYNVSSTPRLRLGAKASMCPGEIIAKGNNIDMSNNPIVEELRAKAAESAKGFIDGLAKRMAGPATSAITGGKAAAGAAQALGGTGAASALSGAAGAVPAATAGAAAAAPAAAGAGGAAAGGAGLGALAGI